MESSSPVTNMPASVQTAPATVTQNVTNPAAVPVMNQPPPAPVMPVAPATPVLENGGSTGGDSGLKNFFDGMSIVDVGFMILGAAALGYSIYYWRIKIMFHKREYLEINQQLNRHDAQIAALKKAPVTANTGSVGMNGMKRSFRRA